MAAAGEQAPQQELRWLTLRSKGVATVTVAQGSALRLLGVRIYRTGAEESGSGALVVTGGSRCVLGRCSVESTCTTGVLCEGEGSSLSLVGCAVRRCALVGVALAGGGSGRVAASTIAHNGIDGVSAEGSGTSLRLHACVVSDHEEAGVFVHSGAEASVVHCRVLRNGNGLVAEDGARVEAQSSGFGESVEAGVRVSDASARITACSIVGNGLAGCFAEGGRRSGAAAGPTSSLEISKAVGRADRPALTTLSRPFLPRFPPGLSPGGCPNSPCVDSILCD